MERLTEKRKYFDCEFMDDGIAEYINRLAAYEDTGLSPEEANWCKLALMGKAIAEITEFEGTAIERLIELVKADTEGRLVVLPCKVGTPIYYIRKTKHGYRYVNSDDFKMCNIDWFNHYFGKTIFLTREEAEAALKGGDGGE